MSPRHLLLSGSLLLALTAAACSPSSAPSAAPSDAPSVAPSEAPTAAPTEAPTAAPSVAPTEEAPDPSASAEAETVFSFDEIDVEALANVLVEGGWFGERTEETTEDGPLTRLVGTESGVVVGIGHDGQGNLGYVTVYDPQGFATEQAQFDLGVVNGVLLNQTLGTEAVTWLTDEIAKADGASVEGWRIFGPDKVSITIAPPGGSPDEVFVSFERAP